MNAILKKSLLTLALLCPLAGQAEILAMLNYESKPTQTPRREGIAIIDVDPDSKEFGKIVTDIALPADVVAHHIFYNKDLSKAYITGLGSKPLQVMDMKVYPYQLKTVEIPDCQVAEDMVFTEDKRTWFLTCMGSSNVIMGNARSDLPIQTISAAAGKDGKSPFISYPHGIGLREDIDRLIVTSTANPNDFKEAGETVTVIEASTGKVLSTHKMTEKPSLSGVAPVEAVFLPKSTPARVYVNNMFGGTIWSGFWQKDSKSFSFNPVFDFNPHKVGVPLEIYFNHKHDKMYVTTANPGNLNVFDIRNAAQPKLIKSIPTAGGAHHVVFSPDERYAFVQNSFLNLPAMDDGSISVIDLQKLEKVASIDTLKNQGLNPNSIILLPKWHHDDAH